MSRDSLIQQLITAFRCLPGVGPKSAQRMTFFLLQRDRQGGRHLADSLVAAMSKVGNCKRCRTLSEKDVCAICENPKRDSSQLCVVESPADMAAIEHGTGRPADPSSSSSSLRFAVFRGSVPSRRNA